MATFEIISGGGSSSVVGYPEGTKMYVALLTQTGTDAPVATVLVNTLGGTVVWTRGGVGSYTGTLAGAFTENKTILSFLSTFPTNQLANESANVDFVRVNSDSVKIEGVSDDGQLTNTPIQILVFP